jgi:hypothetical protein|eukprot:COSAG02_NODE_1880_length_10551_cov_2.925947_4_plen_69_part_00
MFEFESIASPSQLGRIAETLSSAIREHGILRIYYGLKEEMVGLSLKGGIRWMAKPAFDGFCLALFRVR